MEKAQEAFEVAPATLVCDLCSNSQNDVTVRCGDCEMFLCEACRFVN